MDGFTLRGERVCLRSLTAADAEALAEAARVRTHFGYNPVPSGPSEAVAYIEAAQLDLAVGRRLPFAVEFDGAVVGTTSYWELEPWSWPAGSPNQRTDRPDVVEIGSTWLAHHVLGSGCNVEAKLLQLTHAFETWGVYGVAFRTDARNLRSRGAIERLGATLEGVRRAEQPGMDGSVRDSAFYSIVAGEWHEIRWAIHERLEQYRRQL